MLCERVSELREDSISKLARFHFARVCEILSVTCLKVFDTDIEVTDYFNSVQRC